MIDAPIWLLDKMSQHGASFPRTYLFDRQQEGMMNIDLSRRGFLRLAGAGVAATSLGALGFGGAEAAEQAHVRAFKLFNTTERVPAHIVLSPAAS